ncbi:endonuclease/exonuclease/phosphatase family protein [Natronoflexus pectinivorans]|uniref:Endonuclease/exonuclease/phosphatase (EEP) superfamily protein YafD n=1 Tax=Natronoflexus pectinivorans TaxID=682526 RepID=A0A4R2GPS7_9BACT|nr:endonuclease/exonuclease/phosphatase family protein [Natronoflexus pectinivorans]TCO11097.1 endonuclease/exonuclease/phosphatase (EEP) superfamily protein YafD [Natronoflexus pectinivorans]
MQIFTIILCAAVLIATALPFINSAAWWIRIFDFPRTQIAFLILVAIILAYIFLDFKWAYKLLLLLVLSASLLYQLRFVLVYMPFYKTQAKDSTNHSSETSFSLLVSNVRMESDHKERLNMLVKKYDPDILLLTEPNYDWAASISKLDENFPYAIKHPLENTYGMMLLSKLPLTESSVNFLVKDDVPSFFSKITLPSGTKIDFYGVHPQPPQPGSDTYERDTELLIIGRKIRESNNPTIVAGDLNDVGWSVTSKLFRKYSELVDPREGRGLFNTYNVFVPLLRYPLDHIFYSSEFGLTTLKKLEDIGSDHFPLLIGLNFEPEEDNTEDIEKPDADEKAEVEEKIENGKKESAEE